MSAMFRAVRSCAPHLTRRLCSAPAAAVEGTNFRSVVALDGNNIRPYIQPNAHIAPNALVLGSVALNDFASVLPGATVRGDLGLVEIGAYTVVGEGAAVIASGGSGVSPRDAEKAGLPCPVDCALGDYTRIESGAVLTSCILEGENVVGANAVVGERAEMGRGARLAPNSVLPPDAKVPENELWGGNPAMKIGDIKQVEVDEHYRQMEQSSEVTKRHMYEFLPGQGTMYWEKEALAKSNA